MIMLTYSEMFHQYPGLNTMVMAHFNEVKLVQAGSPIEEPLYEELYDYFIYSGTMPYGVAKAITEDPYQWIEKVLRSLPI